MKLNPKDFWGIKPPKKVYFDFQIRMEEEFNEWSSITKDRFVAHFSREHASDTYNGDIDCFAYATGWLINGVFGEGHMLIPEKYNDFGLVEFEEVALDFLYLIKKYDLSRREGEMIRYFDVINIGER